MHGTLETIDGRPALRFERRLAHPVDAVWRAVTEPSELTHWFPSSVSGDLRAGGRLSFAFETDGVPPMEGEVLELEPPRRFAFLWGEDELRFELEPAEGGVATRPRGRAGARGGPGAEDAPGGVGDRDLEVLDRRARRVRFGARRRRADDRPRSGSVVRAAPADQPGARDRDERPDGRHGPATGRGRDGSGVLNDPACRSAARR